MDSTSLRPSSFGGSSRFQAWLTHLTCGAALVVLTGATQVAPTNEATIARAPVVAQRPSTAERGGVVLAYKFRVGEQVDFVLESHSDVTTKKDDKTTTTHNHSLTERHFQVASIAADGSTVLDLCIDRVKLTCSFDDSPQMTFDTQDKYTPPQFDEVKQSIGNRGQMKIGRTGKLLELTSKVRNAAADEGQNFLVVFPERPLHVSDEWSEDINLRLRVSPYVTQKFQFRRRYTLESIDGNRAKIHMITGEVTPITDPWVRGQLLQLTPEGTIVFDIDKGMIVSRDEHVERSEVDVLGPGSVMQANSKSNEKLVAK